MSDAPRASATSHPLHKLCGQRHALGPCPMFAGKKPDLKALAQGASQRADAAGEKRKAKKAAKKKAKKP